MVTPTPILFIAAAARIASATSVPATKREDVRWPRRERSATPRIHRLPERAINAALSPVPLVLVDKECVRREGRLSLLILWPAIRKDSHTCAPIAKRANLRHNNGLSLLRCFY